MQSGMGWKCWHATGRQTKAIRAREIKKQKVLKGRRPGTGDKEEVILYRKGQLTEEAARSFSQGNAKKLYRENNERQEEAFSALQNQRVFRYNMFAAIGLLLFQGQFIAVLVVQAGQLQNKAKLRS